MGLARQPHRHRAPHDAAGAAGRLQVDAGARRRGALRQDVAVAGGRRRRRDGRDPLGVRPGELGGRAARQHRLQRAGGGLLVGRAGRAGLPAHRRRLPVGPRRAHGAARRRLRGRRGRRRHPGAAPADPAARLPAHVGAHRRRRRRRHRLGGLRRPPLPARRAGRRARLRRAHGRRAVGVPHHPPAGRVRERDVGGRLLGVFRCDQRLGHADRRPRARLRVPAPRHPRPTTTTAATASATTSSPRASSASTPRPASGSGTSSSSTTASGTTTRRRPPSSWTSRSTGGPSGPSRW